MEIEKESAPRLSVVIPAYNEEQRLRRLLPVIIENLNAAGGEFEILVVSDGSTDGTARVTRELALRCSGLRLIELIPNRGKGGAVRTGMLAARGRYVLFTDADQSTPISEAGKLLAKLADEGYDMAIGSRSIPGAQVPRGQGWLRAFAGRVFGVGIRLLCVRGFHDTQCGFKAMRREVAQDVFSQMTSDTAIFDVEMLVVAARRGYRVAELSVRWTHDPNTRIPYGVQQALDVWRELFRIRNVQKVGLPLRARR